MPEFRNLLMDRPLAFLALKATGPDTRDDRVVELAVARFDPGGTPRRLRRTVDPGRPIPAGAAEARGVADADVAGQLRFPAHAHRLLGILEGCDMAGFGIRRFGLPLLAAELARCGLELPMAGRSVVDALQLDRRLHPRDLAEVTRRRLGREHPAGGSAMAEATAVAEILDAQLGADPGLPPSASGLHAALVEVDAVGLFALSGGRVVFADGRHAGWTPLWAARREPGYLLGLLGEPLLAHARAILQRAPARAGRGA